jgi:hypothetical protein
VEEYGTARQVTDDKIIRRMRFACWITKAIDTHLEYVIFTAFSRRQWFRERASILPYTYIICLVKFIQIRFKALKAQSLLLLKGYFDAHYLHVAFDYLFYAKRCYGTELKNMWDGQDIHHAWPSGQMDTILPANLKDRYRLEKLKGSVDFFIQYFR